MVLRPSQRSLRTAGHAAILVTLLASCTGAAPTPTPSVPATATPTPAAVIDPATPQNVLASGGCDEFGNCRDFEVGVWHAVPFTPSIPCSLTGKTCQLHFEIYAPTSGGPWPLVVLEPGGKIAPWEAGDYLDQMATAVAGRGAVVMVGQWRQLTEWAGRFPDSVADVACAIGVARMIGPDFGANPDRVVLAGHSMASRPVAVLGLTAEPFTPASGACDATAGSLRPEAWVALAGPPDDIASASPTDSNLVAWFGAPRTSDPEAWAAGDPFALVAQPAAGATDLPIVRIQGGLDDSDVDAEAFQADLVAGGYRSQLIQIASADHFGTTVAAETIDAVMALTTAGQ